MNDKLKLLDFKCDYPNCPCLALIGIYRETCWWNTCVFHLIYYKLKYSKYKYGWCLADWLFRLPLVSRLWNWWCKR